MKMMQVVLGWFAWMFVGFVIGALVGRLFRIPAITKAAERAADCCENVCSKLILLREKKTTDAEGSDRKNHHGKRE